MALPKPESFTIIHTYIANIYYLQTEKEARETPSPRQDESNHEEDDDEPLGDDEDEDEDEDEGSFAVPTPDETLSGLEDGDPSSAVGAGLNAGMAFTSFLFIFWK